MTQKQQRQVPAIARAFDTLDLFLDGRGARSVPEIADALGLPRSTTHEIVQTLVMRDCLRPSEHQPNRFELSLHLFELGSAYISRIDLAQQGQVVARALSERCGETVHVATLDGTDTVYLAKAESSQAVRMVSAVGRRLPAHCTAVGKALLAGLSNDAVADRYAGGDQWVTMTHNSLPSLEALLEELPRIRERGIALDDCESNLDVRCVAAPVHDLDGEVVAGISVSVPAHRAERIEANFAAYAREGAERLSASLGYRQAG